MSVNIVTTPTETWLRHAVRKCGSRFLAASPFVTGIFAEVVADVPPGVEKVLLTQVNLKNFALGVSDLGAVLAIANGGTIVRSLPRLHAKVYLMDATRALVTSANATEGGLRRNFECGVAVEEPSVVEELAKILVSGFGANENLVRWEPDELEALKGPVSLVKEMLPTVPAQHIADISKLTLRIPEAEKDRILSSVRGWTSLVLEGVLVQPTNVFTLDSLFGVCESMASVRYPNNRHVRAKLRQQLQRLRDLGLVDFRGGGTYERLIALGSARQ